jgi:hypothetical protein
MLPPDAVSALAQLGAAGLIGLMWLTERRASAARERQLSDAHQRIMHDRTHLAALLSVVTDNTRALTALEAGQRTLTTLIERISSAPPPAR